MAAGCVLVAAIAGSAGYWRGHSAGEAKVQSAWDRERAQLAEEHAKAVAAAREKEQALQAEADQLREETNAKLKEASARAAALADSLRKRPERPAAGSAVSSTASACSGATGAQLARGDGEFLARYAADAARLEAALEQCVRQYEALRKR
jgi:hypothetical protein